MPAIAQRDESIPLYFGRQFRRRTSDALWPAREPLPVLEEARRTIGSAKFSAQYLQNPVYGEGNLLRPEWFGTYDETPPREYFQDVVQSWDTGMTAEPTSDFTVCTTWGFRESRWYLLDLLRRRLDYPDIKREVVRLKLRWQPAIILIEYAGTGIPLAQELYNERLVRLSPVRPESDKVTRAIAQQARLESGRFLIPAEAEWREDFLHEVRAFPSGRYDDQVDSLTQCLLWTGCAGGMAWQERMQYGGRPRRPSYRNRRAH